MKKHQKFCFYWKKDGQCRVSIDVHLVIIVIFIIIVVSLFILSLSLRFNIKCCRLVELKAQQSFQSTKLWTTYKMCVNRIAFILKSLDSLTSELYGRQCMNVYECKTHEEKKTRVQVAELAKHQADSPSRRVRISPNRKYFFFVNWIH